MPFPSLELQEAAHELAGLLRSRGKTICVAETAAGGLISAAILSYPGASKVYAGGLTLYTLPSRIAYAGWTEEHIKNYKGPTPEIVSGIAEHVLGTLNASYAICESGTAGPTGGNTPNRTPGYCALAVACKDGTTVTRELQTGTDDRTSNMTSFALSALQLAIEIVKA